MSDFCYQTASIWGLLGWVVVVLKIVIPLILIIIGMVDLGKAVVADKDDAINKAVETLLKRFVAAVIVFFIPTIISALFNAIGVGNEIRKSEDYQTCVQCLTNVSGASQNSTYHNCKSPVGLN